MGLVEQCPLDKQIQSGDLCLTLTHSTVFSDNNQQHISTNTGGAWLTVWACFAATGCGKFAVIESTMTTSVKQSQM